MSRLKTIKGLLIQYIIIGLICIFAVAAVSMNVVSRHMKYEMADKGKKIIEVLADSVNGSLEHPLSDLYSIKEIIEDEKIIADPGHIMDNFVNNREYFVIVQLASYEGRVIYIAPYNEEFINIDVSRQEYFKNSVNIDTPYWSSTLLSAQLDRPFVSLSLKTAKGILTAFLLPESILASVQELVNLSKSYITVSDRHGVFIVHPDKDKVQQRVNDPSFNKIKKDYHGGISNNIEYVDGEKMVTYVEFIKPLGWMIKVNQSLDIVLKPVNRIIIYIGLLSLAATILFSLLTANQIVKVGKSLENLILSTDEVAAGNYDVKVSETNFKDLNSLIRSFNRMGDSLHQREHELIELNTTLHVQLDRITHAEQTFKTLIESTTGRYGQEFLDNLTKEIAGWFGVETVLVSLFNFDTGIAHTAAMYSDGNMITDYKYPIKGSPCEQVAEYGFKFYDHDVAELFPEDEELLRFKTEAYLGVPMIDVSGAVKGVICALSSNPMILPEWGHDLMEIVASKALAELERMDAEAKIRASLEEKEVMLKEIHHRVKNNMQIVIGLLSLQKVGSDPVVDQQLTESINRIYVMALLHQKLYQSEDLSKVEVREYVLSLLDSILSTSNMTKNLKLNSDIDEINLSLENIIHLGLIINELVTNSLKHAYKGTESPELFVGLKESDHKIVLTVKDNGVGFPADYDSSKSETLGMNLVESLGASLKGKVNILKDVEGGVVELTMIRQ